jgi:hypothetical protein
VDAKAILEKFETFLATIPLDRYREELEPVKTVEQDLPRDLNPLPAIYANYWVSSVPEKFPDYEDFFCTWWRNTFGGVLVTLFVSASRQDFIGH